MHTKLKGYRTYFIIALTVLAIIFSLYGLQNLDFDKLMSTADGLEKLLTKVGQLVPTVMALYLTIHKVVAPHPMKHESDV